MQTYQIVMITALITAIVVIVVKDLAFKCFVEDKSKKNGGVTFWGKTYYFMTQYQIQNACKSIIKSFPEKIITKKARVMEYTLNLADGSTVVKMLIEDSQDIGINKKYKIVEIK